jgi:Regulator of chromosome condensation (RCC1) repeat
MESHCLTDPSVCLRCVQAALGGAHSLLLCSRDARLGKTLACPWGRVSCVLAWGFGQNGQLGLREWSCEALLPRKVAFDQDVPVLTGER